MKHEPLSLESPSLAGGKVILRPGEEVGEHITENREEVIIVLKGNATLVKANERIELSEGETHFIKEGIKHNVKNLSNEPLEYIYVVRKFE